MGNVFSGVNYLDKFLNFLKINQKNYVDALDGKVLTIGAEVVPFEKKKKKNVTPVEESSPLDVSNRTTLEEGLALFEDGGPTNPHEKKFFVADLSKFENVDRSGALPRDREFPPSLLKG